MIMLKSNTPKMEWVDAGDEPHGLTRQSTNKDRVQVGARPRRWVVHHTHATGGMHRIHVCGGGTQPVACTLWEFACIQAVLA